MKSSLFSNNYRLLKVVLLASIIALLCLYSHITKNASVPTLKKCLTNPEKYDGRQLLISIEATAGKVYKDRFELCQGKTTIMVMGSTEDLSPHDYVAVMGVFHREGYITLQKLHVKKLRRLKIAFSLGAALFIMSLFLVRHRFNFREMHFEERSSCLI